MKTANFNSTLKPDKHPPSEAINYNDLEKIMILYRVSNAMLTTQGINRLIHIFLTALTSGSGFFDRAALFMLNERSGFMQGMFGITKESSIPVVSEDETLEQLFNGTWSFPENLYQLQSEADYCCFVRNTRLVLDPRKNASSRAVLKKTMVFVKDINRVKSVDKEIVTTLGIKSFAVVPVISGEKVFGVIIVDNASSGRKIRQGDLGFLQIVANNAGMAIDNAMLYQRLSEANRNLLEVQENLIHQERLATIGEMSAQIAHELKTPLISIAGLSKRLTRSFKSGTSEYASASMISSEAERLEKMLCDILSFGRKSALCLEPVIIQDLIEESILITSPAVSSGISITRNYPQTQLTVVGEKHQLKQVFLNLFYNSIEALSDAVEKNISVTIKKSASKGVKGIMVSVEDTGGGVGKQQLHRLFEPFYTSKVGGTGLGLPIVKRIVNNHLGNIQAHNSEKGLKIDIFLPLDQ